VISTFSFRKNKMIKLSDFFRLSFLLFLFWTSSLFTLGQGGEEEWREGFSKPLQSVVLSASLREVITEVHVDEGEEIKEGQVLVSLENAKELIAVERIEKMIQKAEFDFNASRALFLQNVDSEETMLADKMELSRLQAELKMAQAEVAEREIVSRFDGVVVYRYHEPGEAVNESEPLLKIISVKKLLLLFYLEAEMLASLQLGEKVKVKFPETTPLVSTEAEVHFIDPEIDDRSGTFRVRLLIDNSKSLVRPGMKVLGSFFNSTKR